MDMTTTKSKKKTRPSINIAAIPMELRELDEWVVYKLEVNKKDCSKFDKVPYQPNGYKASTNDPSHRSSFKEVMQAYGTGEYDGIGFCLDELNGLIAIDLDSCRYPNGTLTPWVQQILDKSNTYAEVTPSGTGIRIWAQGTWLANAVAPVFKGEAASKDKNPEIRVFSKAGYVTMTGDRIGDQVEILKAGEALEWLEKVYFPKRKEVPMDPKALEEIERDYPLKIRIKRARAYIKKYPDAILGKGGDMTTFILAVHMVRGFALPYQEAWLLMVEWNNRLEDEWSDDKLDRKIREAIEKSTAKLGYLLDPVDPADEFKESKKKRSGKAKINSRRLDTVEPEQIVWWWKGKIPRGNLIMFAGLGGCGKSTACIDLIARHTTGQPFPNDNSPRKPENVAMINCEDDASTIIRPRLDAAGTDCKHVYILDNLQIGGEEAWINFEFYCDAVEDFIVEHEITLLVIDPISGHMGSTKQNDTAEVRAVLQKLQAMAKRTNCTIIAITHSPKSSSSAQSSIIGSQAFGSTARGGFTFLRDKGNPKRRLMLSAKNNYSADESGVAFSIEDHDGIGHVNWETSPITEPADSFFVTRTGKVKEPKLVDVVAEKLAEFLKEAKPVKEVQEWAKAESISDITLRRAKVNNRHESEKRVDGWYWLPMAGAELWDSVSQGLELQPPVLGQGDLFR